MAGTRKDARGYKLNTGEYQRKDGRYSYKYTDKRRGERRSVYAESLAELRKKERKIIRDIEDGIDPTLADRLTLNELYDKYISEKYDLKPTTKACYIYAYNHYVRGTFGTKKIKSIRYSDVKRFYYELIRERNLKAYTLDNVHSQIHPAFRMAVRDGLLRFNLADEVMAEIKKSHVWDRPMRHALTVPEQRELTTFLRGNREFYGWAPIIMILLGTGMRIGECLGLRWDDLDFKKRMISVNHNLTDHAYGKGTPVKHTDISNASIKNITDKTYTGDPIKQSLVVETTSRTFKEGTNYTVSYKNNVNAGTASVTITGKEGLVGSVTKTFKINKAANLMTAQNKTVKVKASKIKNKKQVIKCSKSMGICTAVGKLQFKLAKVNKKKFKKFFKVNAKNGNIIIKKGLKKGTYKLKINVTAAGNANYLAATKQVMVTVRVK